MAKNYAMGSPMGNNQVNFTTEAPPAIKAIGTTVRDTLSPVSSITTLGPNTTAIEVVAAGGTAFIAWLSQSTVDSSVAGTSVIATGTGANYDHAIPAGTMRRFVVPISVQNNSEGYGSAVGAAVANGLFRNVATRGTLTSIIGITQYGSSNSY